MQDRTHIVKSSKLSETTDLSPNTDRTGALDMSVGATGPIMKAISKRRLHRRQWSIFEVVAMVLLDGTLIATSFNLAHFIRYNVLFKNHFLGYLRANIENGSLSHTNEVFTPLNGF